MKNTFYDNIYRKKRMDINAPLFLLLCWYINRNFITHRHLQSLNFSDRLDVKSVPNFSTTNSFAQDANRVRFSRTGRPIFAHLPTRIRRNEISSRHTLKVCKQNSRANKLKLLRIVRIINFALHIDFNIALYEFEINDEFSLRVIKLIKIQNIQNI